MALSNERAFNPIWLQFKSEQTEELWRGTQNYRHRWLDSMFYFLFAIPLAVQGKRLWQERPPRSDRFNLPITFLIFCMLGLFTALRPSVYVRYRTGIVIVVKVVSTVIGCSLTFIDQAPVDRWYQFVQFELVHYNKVAAVNFLGLLLPLRLQEHLLVQSVLVVTCILYNPGLCQAFRERMPASCQRYETVASVLDSALPPFRLSRREADVAARRSLDTCQSTCLQTHAFIQLAFGFIAPSLVIYLLEQRSRSTFQGRFLQRRPSQQPRRTRKAWLLRGLFVIHLYGGLTFLWVCLRKLHAVTL